MWKRAKLSRRESDARSAARQARTAMRERTQQDRDTRSWAEERKIEERFAIARIEGKRRTEVIEPSMEDRLAAIGLLAPGGVTEQ